MVTGTFSDKMSRIEDLVTIILKKIFFPEVSTMVGLSSVEREYQDDYPKIPSIATVATINIQRGYFSFSVSTLLFLYQKI